jgi:hypothetical protein
MSGVLIAIGLLVGLVLCGSLVAILTGNPNASTVLTVLVVLGTSTWAAFDSAKIQLRQYETHAHPVGVFFEMALLWILMFPWYLVRRSRIQAGQVPKRSDTCNRSGFDSKPNRGTTYTDTKMDAMRTGRGQSGKGQSGGSYSELENLVDLKNKGVLTEEELQAQKAKLLSGSQPSFTVADHPAPASSVAPEQTVTMEKPPLLKRGRVVVWTVLICGAVALVVLGAQFLMNRDSTKSQLAAANTTASTPQTATTPTTTPTETAVPTSAISTSISGTYQMKGSTRNVADSGQTQDQSRTGSLEIIEQSGGRLSFALNAALVVDEATGNIHTGELAGEVDIRNGEAVYVHDNDQEAPGQCKLTIKVAADRIEVNQDQPCGFGTGVDASGTYLKISNEIPKMRTSAVAERL